LAANVSLLQITTVDPQDAAALELLHQAALEARGLYPDLIATDAPLPGNAPAVPRSTYLIAWQAERAVGCAALRPTDSEPALGEVRRMFVRADTRRAGIARALLVRLEQDALTLGFRRLRLETGNRQHAALALYAAHGYMPIAPYGEHAGDATSRCFEKRIGDR
jgi:putative acetyltransferase